MDLKFEDFITVMSILAFSVNAHAEEIAKGSQAGSGNSGVVLSVGQCVLSVQHLYKRVTAGTDELPVISLEEALIDPNSQLDCNYETSSPLNPLACPHGISR